ncbi:hypothetical protein HUJ04_012000 [Dendroctonus ponderosae]|nr:hypothetical protein HUJ04_012000 [Dendroctonus ponderosae]KAH1029125.1 hypothetical protein HUJ05_002423 [Dendroctonus ponderosae]
MSQFKFWNDVNTVLSLDGPITKGPQPRYERKKMSSNSFNLSKQRSLSSSSISVTKTPCKTPLRKSKTPTPNKTGRTPAGDRFIPSRVASNLDLAHYKLSQDPNQEESSAKKELKRMLNENLHCNQRVLSYAKKAPAASEGFQNPMRVLYSHTRTPASVKAANRYIPQAPDRILDAPDIIDDFYLNLMDWGSNNVLAAALGSHVYLWNAGNSEGTGNIEQLLELEGNDYVCSLAWIQEGDSLAVGTTEGVVQLWDCARAKRLRVMAGHSARVGSLAWNSYVVTSGCRSGQILHHDVRQREHVLATISAHSQEVCGLAWSPDGRHLASGGNDNMVNVWSAVSGGCHSNNTPLHTFGQHQAAIKALAWCPWQAHVLATGGGTADRHIRIWNCNTGTCVHSIDTKSQVSSLLWAQNYKELVSGHGFANNEVTIWKYPAMTKVADLKGHTARVLHLAMSPDGSTILSAGADETLRLWKCFVKDPLKTKDKEATVRARPSALKQCIR